MSIGWQYRWWVSAPVNQFSYFVFYIRFTPEWSDDDGNTARWHQQYLTPEGGWSPFPEGGACEPCLTIPGQLAYAINGVQHIDQKKIVEMLYEIVNRIPADPNSLVRDE